MNYGIKVMKVGYSITDTDIRNIILSSKYTMLKYHQDTTTSLTIPNGSSSGTVDISHTLGYVPAYLAYVKSTELASKNYILPYPGGIYSGIGYDIAVDSYATSSKITLRVNNSKDFGTYKQAASDVWDAYWGVNSFILLGKKDGNSRNGAMRFTGVDVTANESLSDANIYFYVQYRSGSGNLITRQYGIDEDNTAPFGSDPMGRPTTDAYYNNNNTIPSPGGFIPLYVLPAVNEIRQRPGWSPGNAMGFKIYDNGTENNTWVEDDVKGSYLKIVRTGSVSFYFRVIIFKDRIDF